MDDAAPDKEPGGGSSRLVQFATITSRVDAFVMRSALEHEGIFAWLGGEYHAGADPISQALGGYRLYVFEAELPQANALASELGWPDSEIVGEGQKRAVLKLLAFLGGFQFFWTIPGIIMGAVPAVVLPMIALGLLGTPVDPRGRNEFYLVAKDED